MDDDFHNADASESDWFLGPQPHIEQRNPFLMHVDHVLCSPTNVKSMTAEVKVPHEDGRIHVLCRNGRFALLRCVDRQPIQG